MHQRSKTKAEDEIPLITKSREEQSEREELLGISKTDIFNRRTERRDRQAKINAKQTTQSLGSLVQRMNDEVKLSEQATMILTTSSSTLKDAGFHMTAIGQTIRSGGKLITKYGRRETTDKILIFLALLFYFGMIVYILRKRVLNFSFLDYW